MKEQYVDRRWNESSMWIEDGMREQYLSFQLRSTYSSLIPALIHILLSHSGSNPHTTLSFQFISIHILLSFHLRSTYCSHIPSSVHILLSHSIFDPHTALIPSSIHILLSFHLRSTYCSHSRESNGSERVVCGLERE
jgi:hypothetical protein